MKNALQKADSEKDEHQDVRSFLEEVIGAAEPIGKSADTEADKIADDNHPNHFPDDIREPEGIEDCVNNRDRDDYAEDCC